MPYRTIDLKIWGDAKFRRLAPPPPNPRDLFFYLLTAKESIPIPGVIPAGAGAMAETLDWPAEGFREAFAQVEAEGLAIADWRAKLVWVPNAIVYNPPESPNHVLQWAKTWELVPECPLKLAIFQRIRTFCEGLGPAFLEAFSKGFGSPPEGLREPYPEPSRSQDQDQDQDQDQEKMVRVDTPDPGAVASSDAGPLFGGADAPPTTPEGGNPKKPKKPSRQQNALAWMREERAKVTDTSDGHPPPAVANKLIGEALDELGAPAFRACYRAFLADRTLADKSPPWPWEIFFKLWRRYHKPGALPSPSSDPKQLAKGYRLVQPGEDIYRSGEG